MKMQDYPQYTITINRKQALKLDLLWCRCGHRPNNHFNHDGKPCARCNCLIYDETLILPKEDGDD